MSEFVSRVHEPVKRKGAARYLRITILSFAGSVILTRIFLGITGFPQLGGGGLHIAHVLLGGVLLFVAALLPLIYSNRWVYSWGSFLAGVGVGLFIDEVGKFITENNDYFHPLAAPIIYSFFLITVLIYTQVRGEPPKDTRAKLYQILEEMEEVLDHDLDPEEKRSIEKQLREVSREGEEEDLRLLAEHLIEFLEYESLHLTEERLGWDEKLYNNLRNLGDKLIKRAPLKIFLVSGFLIIGLLSIARMGLLFQAIGDPEVLDQVVRGLVERGYLVGSTDRLFALAQLVLEVFEGILELLAVGLILIGLEGYGVEVGSIALLISMAVVNVILFYTDQFSTVLISSGEFILYLGLSYYRRYFLPQGK
jgi:hypothetical protein